MRISKAEIRKKQIQMENQINSVAYHAKRQRIRLLICKKYRKQLSRLVKRKYKDPYDGHMFASGPSRDAEIWLFVEEVLRKELSYSRTTYNEDIWHSFRGFFLLATSKRPMPRPGRPRHFRVPII